MAFEYKRNRNKVTSETTSPKFTYIRDKSRRESLKAPSEPKRDPEALANFAAKTLTDRKGYDPLAAADNTVAKAKYPMLPHVKTEDAITKPPANYKGAAVGGVTDAMKADEKAKNSKILSEIEVEKSKYKNEISPFSETVVPEIKIESEPLPDDIQGKYGSKYDPNTLPVTQYINDVKQGKVKGSDITDSILNAQLMPEKDSSFWEGAKYLLNYNEDKYNTAHMSKKERDLYFQIMMSEGVEAADSYYEELLPYLKNRRATEQESITEDVVKDANGWEKAVLTGGEVASTLLSPFNYPLTVYETLSGNELGINNLGLDTATQTIASEIGKDSGFMSWLYQTSVSGLKSAMALAATGGNPMATQIVMGADAATDAIKEGQDRGLTPWQSVIYGTMIGIIEGVTERIGIDAFFSGGKNILGAIFKNFAAEGSEEVVAEFFGNLADIVINNDDAKMIKNYESYVANGYSGREALGATLKDFAADLALAFAGGALIGSGFGGASAGISAYQQSAADTELGNEVLKGTDHAANVQKLIDAAKNTNNKSLARTANKVEKSYSEENGFNTSARNIGRLARLSGEQRIKSMFEAASDEGIKSQTIAKLTESGMKNREAERVFNLIARDASKERVSTELGNLMRNNKTIRPIYEEITKYMSEEEITKRIDEVEKASPVAEISQSLAEQRLKDAGIDVVDENEEIDNIVSVENVDEYGNYILKRESGETYTYDPKSDDMPKVDKNTARKVSYATNFLANGADAYVKLAPDNEDLKFDRDFETVYNNGLKGRDFSPIESSISEDAQRAIYNAGKSDLKNAAEKSKREQEKAKEKETAFVKKQMGFKSERVTISEGAVAKIKSVSDKGISDQYKAAVKVIDGLAKMLQVNINIVASETDAYGEYIGANGQYNRATNTFTFDITSGMDNVAEISYTAMIKTAGHELTHFIQNWSPSKYLTLKNTTLNFLKSKESADWITKELRKIQSDNEAIGKTLTIEQAKDELVADAFEDVLTNIDFAETVLRTDKTLFDKIHSWVKKHANNFKKNLEIAVKDVNTVSDAAKLMREAGKEAQALFNEWADAFSTALENSTVQQSEGPTDADGYVQFKARTNDNNSIKQQIRNSLDLLNGLTVVSSVEFTSNEDKKALREKALKEFSKIGYKVDRQGFGIILLGEKQISDSLNYINTDAEKSALMTVPKVLKRGVKIGEHIDHKARNVRTFTFAAPVLLNGVRGNVAVVVKQTTKNTYHAHRILLPDGSEFEFLSNKKRNAELTSGEERITSDTKRTPIGSTISIDTIPQNPETVNTENEQLSARRRSKDAYIARKRATAKIAKAFVNSLPNSSNKAKLKVLVTNYAKQVETYAREQSAYIEATTQGNEEIATVAYCGMTLAESAIDQIETDVDFASMHNEISAREKLREEYIREGELAEEIRAFESDLTAAEREVRESKRLAEQFAEREKQAKYRAKQIELRNQRDRNTSLLLKEKTRLKSALDKPSENASVPKDAKGLAEQVINLVDALNAFNGTAALTRPSAELIDRIMKMSDDADKLANGSKSKSLAQRVNSIDRMMLNARYSVDQVKAQLSALEKQYKKLSPDYERKAGEKAPSAAASIIYDKSLHDGLKVLVEYFDEPGIIMESGMFFVKEGLKIVRAMNHQILKANETYIKGKNVDVLKLRDGLYNDAQLASPFLNKFLGNGLFSNLLMPKTMFHVVFGATSSADTFYDMFDDGQTRYIRYMNGAREMFLPIEKELSSEKFKSDKLTLKTGLKYTDGTEVLLNYDLAISLIKIVEDADNLRHAVWGGLQIPDIKPYNKGNKVTAYNGRRIVEHAQPESAPEAMSDEEIATKLQDAATKGTELTSEDYVDMYAQQIAWNNRANLAAEIEAKYKAAAAMLKKQMSETETGKQALKALSIISRYYDTYARKYLDEATLEMYGFEKTLQEGKSYYPIRIRKDEQYKSENEFVVRDYSLENWGNMKHRQNSKKGIELFGAFTELENYMESTAKYYAWTRVNKNINKILNTQIADDDGTPTTLMRKINRLHGSYDPKATGVKSVKNWFMTGFTKYMQDLENAIVGVDTPDSKWLSAIHGHFVTTALVLNFSTPLVQYSALPLVASDSGYLNYFKSTFKKPPILNEARLTHIAKYSEVYKYRSSGLINVDVAVARKNKNLLGKTLTSKALAWTESADAQVLGHQYYALLEMVKKNHKGISEEDAARMAGKMLDQTIYDFQANYTVLQRAPVLQGSGWKKMLFGTFRTQQITLLNAYLDSAVRSHTLSAQLKTLKKGTAEYNSTAAKLKESKKRTTKINVAIALSSALNAFIRMGVTFIRHKDDEDERWSKFIWDFFDSYTSMFSIFGDVIGWIVKHLHGESYYDTDIISFGAEGLVEDAFASFADIIDGEEDDTQDRVRDIINVAALLGVPARNAYNLVKALLGWVEWVFDKTGIDYDFDLDEW